MTLILERALHNNGHFDALEREWTMQVKRIDDAPDDYESARLQHARSIVAEVPADNRYGIFVVRDTDQRDESGYAALVHVNHAWPNTSHATLRIVWILLAPKYDYEDTDPLEIGDITAAILYGGIELCQTSMKAGSMKMHLGSVVDRRYASGLVAGLRRAMPDVDVGIRGNWLHLDTIAQQGERNGG